MQPLPDENEKRLLEDADKSTANRISDSLGFKLILTILLAAPISSLVFCIPLLLEIVGIMSQGSMFASKWQVSLRRHVRRHVCIYAPVQ